MAIHDKFKATIDGKEVEVRLKKETLDIERKCDTEYHIAFTQLLQKGIMPRATLEKMMDQRGVWTKENEKQLDELRDQLAKLEIELHNANTHKEGMIKADAMAEIRAQCIKLVEAKNTVFQSSCESLAEAVRRDAYIAYALVYHDTNKPVFKDYEDLVMRADEDVVSQARSHILAELMEGFNTSISELPEVSYLYRVTEKLKESEKEETKNDIKEETNTGTATAVKKKTTTKKKVTKKTNSRSKRT